MFEEKNEQQINQSAGSVPPPTSSGGSQPPEDIFAVTDNNAAPEVGAKAVIEDKKIESAIPPSESIPDEYINNQGSGIPWKNIVIGVVSIAVVCALAFAGYSWFVDRPVTEPTLDEIVNDNLPQSGVSPTSPQFPPEVPLEKPINAAADEDSDGLLDSRELAEGTDPKNPDTDGDGLFDGEEVAAFGTDPLNRDTDGDGFLDGVEVRNGFNPRGDGRLFNIPQ